MLGLGAKQFKIIKGFVPSLALYGASAGIVVVYMTSEWKGRDLLQFVPVYNRKYTEEKERDM